MRSKSRAWSRASAAKPPGRPPFALACGPGLGADGTVQARSSALSSERHRPLISSLIWFQFFLLVLGPTAYLWERVVFHL